MDNLIRCKKFAGRTVVILMVIVYFSAASTDSFSATVSCTCTQQLFSKFIRHFRFAVSFVVDVTGCWIVWHCSASAIWCVSVCICACVLLAVHGQFRAAPAWVHTDASWPYLHLIAPLRIRDAVQKAYTKVKPTHTHTNAHIYKHNSSSAYTQAKMGPLNCHRLGKLSPDSDLWLRQWSRVSLS